MIHDLSNGRTTTQTQSSLKKKQWKSKTPLKNYSFRSTTAARLLKIADYELSPLSPELDQRASKTSEGSEERKSSHAPLHINKVILISFKFYVRNKFICI